MRSGSPERTEGHREGGCRCYASVRETGAALFLRALSSSDTRVHIRGERNGCLVSKGEEWTSSYLRTDLSRTHSTPPSLPPARTLSCRRVHSDETAPSSRAVHAQMRTPKGNPFMLIMKTATGLSYSHSCKLKIGKPLLFIIKLIKNGGKKMH